MKLRILQLNMWAGTHFPAIKDFLGKNDFDLLCLQEVAGIGTKAGNVDCTFDNFKALQSLLSSNYLGELAIAQYSSNNPETGYFGNAIFYKKDFSLQKKNILWLKKRETPFPSDAPSFEEMGRNVLHLTLQKDGQIFNILTAHLAWAKTKEEQPHQRQQNLKLIEYIKNLPNLWTLTGDFNISPENQSIVDLEHYGWDLTKAYDVQNTIDPINHHRWERIKPGFPIDYIFVSPDVQVEKFEVLENVHMSDHLGLTAEIEI